MAQGLQRRRRCAECGHLVAFVVERIERTARHVFRTWVCETCATELGLPGYERAEASQIGG